MSIEVRGVNQLIAKLEEKLGKRNFTMKTDKTLEQIGNLLLKEIVSRIRSAGDRGYAKGYTVDEIKLSDVIVENGRRTVKIYWDGPHNRKNIIHLNEWGTPHVPNPPRKGVIAISLKTIEKPYKDAVRALLGGGL